MGKGKDAGLVKGLCYWAFESLALTLASKRNGLPNPDLRTILLGFC